MRALSDLAHARAQGQAPALPVFVSDLGNPMSENLAGAGALVVPVWDGAELWDWRPVAGLEVILAFRRPWHRRELALAIREASPRRLLSIDWTAPLGEKLSAVLA